MNTQKTKNYEETLIERLRELDHFFTKTNIRYGVFGDIAVLAHARGFINKTHRINVVVEPHAISSISDFLLGNGYHLTKDHNSERAHFFRFTHEDAHKEPKILIYPGAFTLLNTCEPFTPKIEAYEILPGRKTPIRAELSSLTNKAITTHINTIGIEDLVLSQMWPNFTLANTYLLLLLLGTKDLHIDTKYVSERIQKSPDIKIQYKNSLVAFKKHTERLKKQHSERTHERAEGILNDLYVTT